MQKIKLELQEYCEDQPSDPDTRVSRIRNEHLLLNWTEIYTSTDYVGNAVCNSRSWFRLVCTLDLIATHFASADGIEFIEHDNEVRKSLLPFPPICEDWAHLSTEYHGFKHKMVEVFDTLIDRILNGTNGFPQHMSSHGCVASCVADEIALTMAERHIFHHKGNVWQVLPPSFHQFYLSLPLEASVLNDHGNGRRFQVKWRRLHGKFMLDLQEQIDPIRQTTASVVITGLPTLSDGSPGVGTRAGLVTGDILVCVDHTNVMQLPKRTVISTVQKALASVPIEDEVEMVIQRGGSLAAALAQKKTKTRQKVASGENKPAMDNCVF